MDDDKSPETLTDRNRLARRMRLAGAALLWEQLWPALWPAIGIAGAFLALAFFDVPARLPGTVHLALLAIVLLLLVGALVPAFRHFRLPDRHTERRRVERASGLEHRPLTAIEDRLSGGDAATAGLWQIHRERMAAQLRSLRVGWPNAGLVRRDPFALRAALGLVLLIALIDAGGDWPQRLWRAVTPGFVPLGATAASSLDIWLTPPDYTGLPPQFLPASPPAAPISVPSGSTVLAQVQGGTNAPRLVVDKRRSDFERVDERNFKGSATLTGGSRLAVEQDGRPLGSWPIAILPDQPPTIAFAKPPQRTQRAALRLEYQAKDDYGVESVKAIISRPGDPSAPLVLDLPLPGPHLKEAHDASFHDLSAHPWAGLPVDMRLQAADALGQTGESETIRTTLPERVFHHPVARAIIDQRKQLTLDPSQREVVAETLSDLSLRPRLFDDDTVVFLALRTAQARLVLDKDAAAIPAVQQLLWETALRIEDGRSSLAQRDVRDAMKALQDALARNAPDSEIDRLTRELREAMDRYLQELAQNMQRQGDQDQNLPPLDPSKVLNSQDLQKMLDRARELARTGSRDAARDLLSQLQEMLENLRMAKPGQMQNGQGQAMRQMQEMMRRQQQLLDRSFRQSRQGQQGQRGQRGKNGQQNGQQNGQPQMGDGQGDGDMAGDQEALRRMLGEMMRKLGEQSGDIPQSLGRAERAMRGAADALSRGQPGNAISPQTEALDQLQQAARSMAEQMMGQSGAGRPGGTDPGDRDGLRQAERDPFGRLNAQDHANGGVDDGGAMRMGNGPLNNYAVEKAKGILEELRRRAGERSRPEIERDYIDRLLKQF